MVVQSQSFTPDKSLCFSVLPLDFSAYEFYLHLHIVSATVTGNTKSLNKSVCPFSQKRLNFLCTLIFVYPSELARFSEPVA